MGGLRHTQALLDSLLCKDPQGRPASAAAAGIMVQAAIRADLDTQTPRAGRHRPKPVRRVAGVLGLAALGGGTLGLAVAAMVTGGWASVRLAEPGMVGARADWSPPAHSVATPAVPNDAPVEPIAEIPNDVAMAAAEPPSARSGPEVVQEGGPRRATERAPARAVAAESKRRGRKTKPPAKKSQKRRRSPSAGAWDLRDPF